ncbi:MAG TPA: thermonuclease family protein [Patescibacteria group bacterium]|jgi:micrococcal nuclease|nr:thermonuclease family protein [Patescibacteria group bacterium]
MNKRKQKQLLSMAAFGAMLTTAALGQHLGWWVAAKQAVIQTQPGLYTIDHFVDGDTIAVKMNGKVESVRMIGIDTPETHKPNSPVQCYGQAAASYVKNLIGSSQVRLGADQKSTNRDRYDRLLRYVYLPNGRLVAAETIKNGYGFAYTSFPFTKSAEFEQDQAAARAADKGLWGSCKPYQQTNGRWQTENITP